MRQLFVIGLLTMMKASNAIYRENEVPADVDGAVLMAASYTKILPSVQEEEIEHNHDHDAHDDLIDGNDEYFQTETNEIKEVYVDYPAKEDEWIKEWELNDNISEEKCVYTECTKGNYCQEISCMNDICYRVFYDENWTMVSERCKEEVKVVDVIDLLPFIADKTYLSEDVNEKESDDKEKEDDKVESNRADEKSKGDTQEAEADLPVKDEDMTLLEEVEESEIVDNDSDDNSDDNDASAQDSDDEEEKSDNSAEESDDDEGMSDDSAEEGDDDEQNSENQNEEGDQENQVDETDESAKKSEDDDDSEVIEISDDEVVETDEEVKESDDETDDVVTPLPNKVVCNETCAFNDCSAEVGGQVCWRQDCDDQCGKKTCTKWLKDNTTGEWQGQYCSGDQQTESEQTEMSAEQIMNLFKDSVETYGDTILELTQLTGADADIADQVISLARNPEQLLNQTTELESLVDPALVETLINTAIQGMQTQVESLLNNTEVMEGLTSIGEKLLSDPGISELLQTPEAQTVMVQANQMAGLLANPETAGPTIEGAVEMIDELIDSLEVQEEVKAPLAEIFGVFSRGVKNSGLNRKDRRP